MSHWFADRSRAAALALLVPLAAPGFAAPVLADGLEKWAPNGIHVVASENDRVFPIAIEDGAGGAFVVWQERGMIRMQRLTAAGAAAPGWSGVAGLLVCSEANRGGWMQSSPRAIADGAGGVYVLWMDQRNRPCDSGCIGDPRQIFVQRVGGDGAIAPGWPALGVDAGSALGTMNPQPAGLRGYAGEMNPAIAPDGEGGLLVAWTEGTTAYFGARAPIPGVHVQRLSAAGERRWGERGVLVSPAAAGLAAFPAIAPDGAGGALVAWQERRGALTQIRLQHLSPAGTALLAAGGEAHGSGEGHEREPQLLPLESGAALLVWQSGDGEARSLYTEALGGERHRVAIPTLVTESAIADGEIALLAGEKGDAWLAWSDAGEESAGGIRIQHLRKDAGVAGGWPEGGVAVCRGGSEACARPVLAADGARGVYVGWRDPEGPRVTRFAEGSRARGWPAGGLALTAPLVPDKGFHMVSDQASGAIVVWDQWMSAIGIEDIRGQRVGPVAPSRAKRPARRGELAEEPGLATPRFALAGLQPNPAAGPCAIAFSLASGEPAQLEVFDLSGRRVLAREVGALGAGPHRIALAGEARLHPGLYAIRLTQAGRQLTARGIVTR